MYVRYMGQNLLLTLSAPFPVRLLKIKEIQMEKQAPQATHNNSIKIASSLESEGKKCHRYLAAKPGVSASVNAQGLSAQETSLDYWSSPVSINRQRAVTGEKMSQERHKNSRRNKLKSATSCFQVHSWVQLQEGKMESFLKGRREDAPANGPLEQSPELPILGRRGQGEVIFIWCLCSELTSKNPSRNRSSL